MGIDIDINIIRTRADQAREAGDTGTLQVCESLISIAALAEQPPVSVEIVATPGGALPIGATLKQRHLTPQPFDLWAPSGDRRLSVFLDAIEAAGVERPITLMPEGDLVMLVTSIGVPDDPTPLVMHFGGTHQGMLLKRGYQWVVMLVPSRKPEAGEVEAATAMVIAHAAEAGIKLEPHIEPEIVVTSPIRLQRAVGAQVVDPNEMVKGQTIGLADYGDFLDLTTGKPVERLPPKPLNDVQGPSWSEAASLHAEQVGHFVSGVRAIAPAPEPPPAPVAAPVAVRPEPVDLTKMQPLNVIAGTAAYEETVRNHVAAVNAAIAATATPEPEPPPPAAPARRHRTAA